MKITFVQQEFLFAVPVSKPLLTILPNMGDVTEGQDVTLVCSVQRGTPPILFTWHHAKGDRKLASYQTFNELEASFKIRNVRGEQQGLYYCMSTNSAGDSKQSQTVTIGGTSDRSCMIVLFWVQGLLSEDESQIVQHDGLTATHCQGVLFFSFIGGGNPSLCTISDLTWAEFYLED